MKKNKNKTKNNLFLTWWTITTTTNDGLRLITYTEKEISSLGLKSAWPGGFRYFVKYKKFILGGSPSKGIKFFRKNYVNNEGDRQGAGHRECKILLQHLITKIINHPATIREEIENSFTKKLADLRQPEMINKI